MATPVIENLRYRA